MGKQGWFTTNGREGDRTVEQQMIGLDHLIVEVRGKTILDVGCAEGLIDVELAKAGAAHVLGVEIVKGHIDVARRHAVAGVTDFIVADANVFAPKTDSFDVVLLLAILHKLRNPMDAAQRLAAGAKSMVVVRLPPAGAVFTDSRSGGKPQDIGRALTDVGFDLEFSTHGSFDEWIGFYRRRAAAAALSFPPQVYAALADAAPAAPEPPAAAPTPAPDELAAARAEVAAPRGDPTPTVDTAADFVAPAKASVDMSQPAVPNEPTSTADVPSGAALFPTATGPIGPVAEGAPTGATAASTTISGALRSGRNRSTPSK